MDDAALVREAKGVADLEEGSRRAGSAWSSSGYPPRVERARIGDQLSRVWPSTSFIA